jgi:hypothetical protein
MDMLHTKVLDLLKVDHRDTSDIFELLNVEHQLESFTLNYEYILQLYKLKHANMPLGTIREIQVYDLLENLKRNKMDNLKLILLYNQSRETVFTIFTDTKVTILIGFFSMR